MRMRRKKNLEQRIAEHSGQLLGYLIDYAKCSARNICFIREPLDFREIFGNDHPVHLEIGCGKGGFAASIAATHPEINFVALEKCKNVIVSGLEREDSPKNLRYIIGLAEFLETGFGKGSVSEIYLNFSCPYPKTSYASKRLTHSRFLKIYREILTDEGIIRQKTDSPDFFRFSLKSFSENGYEIAAMTENLHADNALLSGNVSTEYEKNFVAAGKRIYYAAAKKKKFFSGT
ncbi:tRNA (guanine-N(7)-)-methyltransferase [Clostridia bacterium]|nr:tRNA (guanine-N(7)-)-methyltransferase [Clostridia bacterium]